MGETSIEAILAFCVSITHSQILFSALAACFVLAREKVVTHASVRCQKVLKHRFPMQTCIPNVLHLLDPSFLRELLACFPSVREVLVTGGFPCQGFSGANPVGKGLHDSRSGLFYVLPVVACLVAEAGLWVYGAAT